MVHLLVNDLLLTYSRYWPTNYAYVNIERAWLTCCGPCTYSGKDQSSCYGGISPTPTPSSSCTASTLSHILITVTNTASGVLELSPDYPEAQSVMAFLGLHPGCLDGIAAIAQALDRVSYLIHDSTSIINGPFVSTSTSPIPAGTSLTIPLATSSKPSVCTPHSGRESLRKDLLNISISPPLQYRYLQSPSWIPRVNPNQPVSPGTNLRLRFRLQ